VTRLQKLLASAGLGSRREVEQWIREGRVTIGGRIAQLGDRAAPEDDVRLDGVRVPLAPERAAAHELLLYNKPVGEVTTRSDPQGRPTVFERLPRPRRGRWIAVGRLDVNTSGLLLFTTDGELAHRLMHPSAEVEREYRVRVRGRPAPAALAALRRGVELEDGPAHFERLVREPGLSASGSHSWYRVVLKEGRNREVRRMWGAVGCEVSRLARIRYGPLELPSSLPPGGWRHAGSRELDELAGTLLAAGSRATVRAKRIRRGPAAHSSATQLREGSMQVLVSSDHRITASEDLASRITSAVTNALDRWGDRITRVEVHLSDLNSKKSGKTGKRCVLEAHLGGLKPVAVHDDAHELMVAVDGSIAKLLRALEHTLGRLQDTPGRAPNPRQIASVEELERVELMDRDRSERNQR
jgi:23S rRNA pseudouridine2605 synthase